MERDIKDKEMVRDYTQEEKRMLEQWLKHNKPKVQEAVEHLDGYAGHKRQGGE